jgi:hypothetical protein
MLGLLVLSRLAAAASPNNFVVTSHCAAVHVLEAFVFGYEKLCCKSGGDNVIFSIILANAAVFTGWAGSLV